MKINNAGDKFSSIPLSRLKPLENFIFEAVSIGLPVCRTIEKKISLSSDFTNIEIEFDESSFPACWFYAYHHNTKIFFKNWEFKYEGDDKEIALYLYSDDEEITPSAVITFREI